MDTIELFAKLVHDNNPDLDSCYVSVTHLASGVDVVEIEDYPGEIVDTCSMFKPLLIDDPFLFKHCVEVELEKQGIKTIVYNDYLRV